MTKEIYSEFESKIIHFSVQHNTDLIDAAVHHFDNFPNIDISDVEFSPAFVARLRSEAVALHFMKEKPVKGMMKLDI